MVSKPQARKPSPIATRPGLTSQTGEGPHGQDDDRVVRFAE